MHTAPTYVHTRTHVGAYAATTPRTNSMFNDAPFFSLALLVLSDPPERGMPGTCPKCVVLEKMISCPQFSGKALLCVCGNLGKERGLQSWVRAVKGGHA